MVWKSDEFGLRTEIATVQVLILQKAEALVNPCASVFSKLLWWLQRSAKQGVSRKIKHDKWELTLIPHLYFAWNLADAGGKWATGKSFSIKLMLLLWILLSSAILLWGCPNNFGAKTWTCFLVFCLFMTWCRTIYSHSGCIFLCSFKHCLNSPSASSRTCHLCRLMWYTFPAHQLCPSCFLSLNQNVGRNDNFSMVYKYVPRGHWVFQNRMVLSRSQGDFAIWDPQEDILMI